MRDLDSLERRSVRNASQVGFLEDNLLIPEGWPDTNPTWWCKAACISDSALPPLTLDEVQKMAEGASR